MGRLTVSQRIAALLLIVGALTVGDVLFRPVAPTHVGMAPNFHLSSTDGRVVTLSEYRGHPVLLNFFATWCTTCKAELSAIARARDQHPRLVTLLIDERETQTQVNAFLHALHVPGPALLDASGSVAAKYAIAGQPVTVWVAPSGHIRATSIGPIDSWIINARYSDLTART